MPFVLRSPHRTLVVPGHGYISDYAEVVEYQYMVNVIHDRIEALVDKGMSLEQVIDANPTAGFREPLRLRFGALDDRHVRRGHLQRPEERAGGTMRFQHQRDYV